MAEMNDVHYEYRIVACKGEQCREVLYDPNDPVFRNKKLMEKALMNLRRLFPNDDLRLQERTVVTTRWPWVEEVREKVSD